ncbi:ribonuclease HII [Deefgea piscis]|uniref:ribonuclease HII n=1 Tax=Deefgea piscis TaxID=2739061 RepID=UPI001C7F99CE|nr:ribonuclease HII [Deefgea piscis]QZA79978.1 ribonuclease HII [Deefgea piscis]
MLICGVDEAGRGPLVGSVFAGAVILPSDHTIEGLTDSKKLSEKQRDRLAICIKEQAIAWAIASASAAEVDEINILQATMLAMQRAVGALSITPSEVLVDGNRTPLLAMPSRAIIKGDATEACISAASILAKVSRDAEAYALDLRYPQYGFAQHKGYGTAQHLAALAQFGPIPEHRTSFAPVRAAYAQRQLF